MWARMNSTKPSWCLASIFSLRLLCECLSLLMSSTRFSIILWVINFRTDVEILARECILTGRNCIKATKKLFALHPKILKCGSSFGTSNQLQRSNLYSYRSRKWLFVWIELGSRCVIIEAGFYSVCTVGRHSAAPVCSLLSNTDLSNESFGTFKITSIIERNIWLYEFWVWQFTFKNIWFTSRSIR